MTHYITSDQVIARYCISQMTLWRWEHENRAMGFPKPMRINRRKLWSLADLDEWDQMQRNPLPTSQVACRNETAHLV